MKLVQILPEVLQDVADAAKWYDEEGYQGLGDRFIEAFYNRLSEIQRNGEIHRFVYHHFRKSFITPFPYSLFYREHNNVWIATLVIHAAKNPHFSQALLKQRQS